MGWAFGSDNLCLTVSFLKVGLCICSENVPCPEEARAEGMGARQGLEGAVVPYQAGEWLHRGDLRAVL